MKYELLIKVIGLLAPAAKLIISKTHEYVIKRRNENFELNLNLVELQKPPKALLTVLRDQDIKDHDLKIRCYKNLRWLYLLLFCIQFLIVVLKPTIQEIGFAVGFFLFSFAFAHLARAFWKRKEHLNGLPLSPIGLSEKHLIGELTFKEDVDFLFARTLKALKKIGAIIYQISSPSSGQITIVALKDNASFWSKYKAKFNLPDEIEVNIKRKGNDECSMRLEISFNRSYEISFGNVSKFMRSLLTQSRAQQVAETDRQSAGILK